MFEDSIAELLITKVGQYIEQVDLLVLSSEAEQRNVLSMLKEIE